MAFDLFEHIRASVAPGGDGEDVDQARHRGPAAPLAGHLVVMQGLVIEKIQAQKGAHPLVQRLLENQGFGVGARVGLGTPFEGLGVCHLPYCA